MNLRKFSSKKWFKEQSNKLNDSALENKEVTKDFTDEEKQLIRQVFEKSLISISLDKDFESEKTINDLSEFISFIRRYIVVASDNEERRLLFSAYVT